jgi:hypothetical protein
MPAPRPVPPNFAERLGAARVLVERAASYSKGGRAALVLKEALAVLDELRDQVPTAAPGRGPRPARRVLAHTVERRPEGWMLAEYRSGRAHPFRCPEKVFWACAESIQKAGAAPVKFTDLKSTVEKKLGQAEPIYLFRITLRFLDRAGLIQHRQARFWTKRPDFKAAVKQEWERAKERTPPPLA